LVWFAVVSGNHRYRLLHRWGISIK